MAQSDSERYKKDSQERYSDKLIFAFSIKSDVIMTGHYNYISNTHVTFVFFFVNVMKKQLRHLHHFYRKKIAKTVLCGQEETEIKTS